jgi:hypothetical protein
MSATHWRASSRANLPGSCCQATRLRPSAACCADVYRKTGMTGCSIWATRGSTSKTAFARRRTRSSRRRACPVQCGSWRGWPQSSLPGPSASRSEGRYEQVQMRQKCVWRLQHRRRTAPHPLPSRPTVARSSSVAKVRADRNCGSDRLTRSGSVRWPGRKRRSIPSGLPTAVRSGSLRTVA